MSFRKFAIFNANGDLYRYGDCIGQEMVEAGETVFYDVYVSPNSYLLNGEIKAYTNEQMLEKANRPNRRCRWDNLTMQWVDLPT